MNERGKQAGAKWREESLRETFYSAGGGVYGVPFVECVEHGARRLCTPGLLMEFG